MSGKQKKQWTMSPKRRPHPDAKLPNLRLNDLFLLKGLHKGYQEGKALNVIMRDLGLTKKQFRRLERDFLKEVLGTPMPQSDPQRLNQRSRQNLANRLDKDNFLKDLDNILDHFNALFRRAKEPTANRVIIEAIGFADWWLLPKAFKQSSYLEKHTRVHVEVRRETRLRFINDLIRGTCDLALGPEIATKPGVDRLYLFAGRKAIIYRTPYAFKCGKKPADITVEDLALETVFAIPFQGIHTCSVPKREGRLVLVGMGPDVYSYVLHGLGVGIAYAKQYFPFNIDGKLETINLDETQFPPERVYLYFPNNRRLSEAVLAMKDTITDFVTSMELR
jgi:DNA-binding transcriptional LysR family regulator